MTNDPQFAQRMTIFCERGNDAYAISELQAAVLIPQLKHLPSDALARRTSALKLLKQLETIPWIRKVHGDVQLEARNAPYASYYKLGLQLDHALSEKASRQSFAKSLPETNEDYAVGFRDSVLKQLNGMGLKIGPGFRGFLGRSKNRCRQPLRMASSTRAIQSTIVLDHSLLLCPETGDSSVERVLDAFATLNKLMPL